MISIMGHMQSEPFLTNHTLIERSRGVDPRSRMRSPESPIQKLYEEKRQKVAVLGAFQWENRACTEEESIFFSNVGIFRSTLCMQPISPVEFAFPATVYFQDIFIHKS